MFGNRFDAALLEVIVCKTRFVAPRRAVANIFAVRDVRHDKSWRYKQTGALETAIDHPELLKRFVAFKTQTFSSIRLAARPVFR